MRGPQVSVLIVPVTRPIARSAGDQPLSCGDGDAAVVA
jgi:hypothetical protein